MTVIRFLWFSFLYGHLFYFLSLLLAIPLFLTIEAVYPDGEPEFVRVSLGFVVVCWGFLGIPFLTYQTAKRRATTEPSLKQSLVAFYYDSKLLLSTLPIVGNLFIPSDLPAPPPDIGISEDQASAPVEPK